MRRWKLIAIFLLAILSPHFVCATDIPIFPTGPVFPLNNLAWGTSTQPGFNNNFFFTPYFSSESVCIYVYNNNPTNAHLFTISVSTTADPSNSSPSGGTWQILAQRPNITLSTSPSSPLGLGVSVTSAAQISINLSASIALGGVPDTAKVIISQTTGTCLLGNGFVGSAPSQTATLPMIQAVNDTLSQSFVSFANAVNPGANAAILFVNDATQPKDIYFDSVTISSTAAAQINIATNSLNSGTGCSGASGFSLRVSSPISSIATISTCTGAAGGSAAVIPLQLAANTPVTIDLKGFIASQQTTTGMSVTNPAAITGTVSVSIRWYEK